VQVCSVRPVGGPLSDSIHYIVPFREVVPAAEKQGPATVMVFNINVHQTTTSRIKLLNSKRQHMALKPQVLV
jgi:hypothetical protein